MRLQGLNHKKISKKENQVMVKSSRGAVAPLFALRLKAENSKYNSVK